MLALVPILKTVATVAISAWQREMLIGALASVTFAAATRVGERTVDSFFDKDPVVQIDLDEVTDKVLEEISRRAQEEAPDDVLVIEIES